MSGKFISEVFEQYRKARIAFVTSISDLATRPCNLEFLEKADTLNLLRPLLLDNLPAIQQMAAIALGRVANLSENLAIAILENGTLATLLTSLEDKNKCYRKAVMFTLRALSKHSSRSALGVVSSGGLQAIVLGLQDFDIEIRESAAWAVGYVARHEEVLARNVVEAGALPLLLNCITDKKITLKQIGAAALCDISKHSFLLAQNIVDTGIVRALVKHIDEPDTKFKRQLLAILANVARHNTDLAEHVVETEVLPEIYVHMAHPDPVVQKNASNVIREIVKHSIELSQIVVNSGGIAALLEVVAQSETDSRVPAILALGFMSVHSEYTAITIIKCQGIEFLSRILYREDDQHILAACAWTLGQIGRHSPAHSQALAAAHVLPRLLEFCEDRGNSNNLRIKSKEALKLGIRQCPDIETLAPFITEDISHSILKSVLQQFAKILPVNAPARREFVTTGCLRRLQQIHVEPDTKMAEYINVINCCFPDTIVRYYSPGYPEAFLDMLSSYVPKLPSSYYLAREQGGEEEESETETEELHLHNVPDIIIPNKSQVTPGGNFERNIAIGKYRNKLPPNNTNEEHSSNVTFS